MKNQYASLVLLMLFSIPILLYVQDSGEDLFKAIYVTCLTIGCGHLIGSDLSGVNDRKEPEWLFRFRAVSCSARINMFGKRIPEI